MDELDVPKTIHNECYAAARMLMDAERIKIWIDGPALIKTISTLVFGMIESEMLKRDPVALKNNHTHFTTAAVSHFESQVTAKLCAAFGELLAESLRFAAPEVARVMGADSRIIGRYKPSADEIRYNNAKSNENRLKTLKPRLRGPGNIAKPRYGPEWESERAALAKRVQEAAEELQSMGQKVTLSGVAALMRFAGADTLRAKLKNYGLSIREFQKRK